MHKALIVVIALASLWSFSQAWADSTGYVSNCNESDRICKEEGVSQVVCTMRWKYCVKTNVAEGFNPAGQLLPGANNNRNGDGSGGRPGGGGGSKPKQVNGQSQRTADGGTVMVTPEGKEWVWNGKYTSVVTINRAGYQETINVMQGDPTVSLTKVVDGRRYNVADPKYAAAVAASLAKADAAKAREKAAAQQASAQQKQNYINNVQSPTGIIGAGKPPKRAQ